MLFAPFFEPIDISFVTVMHDFLMCKKDTLENKTLTEPFSTCDSHDYVIRPVTNNLINKSPYNTGCYGSDSVKLHH